MQARAVVIHELAHARRRVDALQTVVEAAANCLEALLRGHGSEALARFQAVVADTEASLAHNPVAQQSTGQGDIELF